MPLRSINPSTGQPLQEYPEHSPQQIRAVLDQADRAATQWRDVPIDQRSARMRRVGELLRQRRSMLSELMTQEMGKPIAGGEAEIDKCAGGCDHFAQFAQSYLAPESIASDAVRSGVRYEPLGAVLAIMPWNFPFWQVFRFAAPALMAGNVGLLKHAPNVCGCALAIEALFRDADFPTGTFQTLLIDTAAVEPIIRGDVVKAVTLTGSERAGRSVAAIAGSALKKTVLELGGSDPFIVLPDSDPVATAQAAAAARCINSGQSCIAAKRFIVVGENAAFQKAFVEAMEDQRVGDPMDRRNDIGPLARGDLLENLERQVSDSIAAGARLLTGGRRLGGAGFFYAPTLLSGVRPGMAAFDEETFGPVAALIQAKDLDEAIRLANATKFGLGASIWTGDAARAEREIVPRIEAGAVFVNGPVKSDVRLPFGGVKNSGYGRELARSGIQEFVNIKTVWVK